MPELEQLPIEEEQLPADKLPRLTVGFFMDSVPTDQLNLILLSPEVAHNLALQVGITLLMTELQATLSKTEENEITRQSESREDQPKPPFLTEIQTLEKELQELYMRELYITAQENLDESQLKALRQALHQDEKGKQEEIAEIIEMTKIGRALKIALLHDNYRPLSNLFSEISEGKEKIAKTIAPSAELSLKCKDLAQCLTTSEDIYWHLVNDIEEGYLGLARTLGEAVRVIYHFLGNEIHCYRLRAEEEGKLIIKEVEYKNPYSLNHLMNQPSRVTRVEIPPHKRGIMRMKFETHYYPGPLGPQQPPSTDIYEVSEEGFDPIKIFMNARKPIPDYIQDFPQKSREQILKRTQ